MTKPIQTADLISSHVLSSFFQEIVRGQFHDLLSVYLIENLLIIPRIINKQFQESKYFFKLELLITPRALDTCNVVIQENVH